MISVVTDKRLLSIGAFIIATMFSLSPRSVAAPAVAVGTSFNQGVLSVTMTASSFPELRSITFDCTYDPQRISIMDAIVGSPLAATALGVAVDTAAHSLRLIINAASTVTVGEGKPLVNLFIPTSQEDGKAFMVSKVAITDKNGAVINVTIHSTAVRLSKPGSSLLRLAIQRKATGTIGLQLDGRRFSRDRKEAVSGYVIRRTGGTATSGMILIR